MFEQVTLEGWHVKLVPMDLKHAVDLYEVGQATEIWRYLPVCIKNRDDMRRWVEKALREKERGLHLPFVILDQCQNVVGSTRIFGFPGFGQTHRTFEIGWTWLSPHVWRKKINSVSKYLLLNHCFDQLQAVRVQIKTDSRNIRSQKAIEKIGATLEGTFRRHQVMPDGWIRDSVYYSIILEEWPFLKCRLEVLLRDIPVSNS